MHRSVIWRVMLVNQVSNCNCYWILTWPILQHVVQDCHSVESGPPTNMIYRHAFMHYCKWCFTAWSRSNTLHRVHIKRCHWFFRFNFSCYNFVREFQRAWCKLKETTKTSISKTNKIHKKLIGHRLYVQNIHHFHEHVHWNNSGLFSWLRNRLATVSMLSLWCAVHGLPLLGTRIKFVSLLDQMV